MAGPTLSFSQTSGLVTDEAGNHVALGWSGNHDGKGNPAMQAVHCVGPLPQGLYRVDPWEEQHGHLGPMVAHLEQVEGETYGRDDFFIHGPASIDSDHYGQESMGCIVVPRAGRQKIRDLAPDFVRVTA
jgi:hypothetical protein